MSGNEAHARIKSNKLLDEAGWRFSDTVEGTANIVLKHNVKITQLLLDERGNDFERTENGFTDYSLIDDSGRVVCIVEAKAERLHKHLRTRPDSKTKNNLDKMAGDQ